MPIIKVAKPRMPWNKRIAPREAGKQRLTRPHTKLITHKMQATRPIFKVIEKQIINKLILNLKSLRFLKTYPI